ncbi:MAG: DNA polymerase III subunit delta' [Rickettsiales bacterium]
MSEPAYSETLQTNQPVLGHEAIEARLLADWNSGRMPHAYLFTGRRGIGKATLAYRFARFILNQSESRPQEDAGLFGNALPPAQPVALESNSQSPASLRMQAGTHSGFMVLQPLYDEKKGRYKDEINVDQVRKIIGFNELTSGESSHKIILIDPAEAMNPAAANALLKWLEEPPSNTIFLLISHNPSRLLPTIKSRCRRVAFSPLSEQHCAQILAAKGVEIEGNPGFLNILAAGSAGILSELAESQIEPIFYDLLHILGQEGTDSTAAYGFAEALPKQISWDNLYLLLVELLAMIIKSASGVAVPSAIPPDAAEVIRQIAGRLMVDAWIRQREQILALHRDTEQLYLDRKHVVMLILDALAGNLIES